MINFIAVLCLIINSLQFIIAFVTIYNTHIDEDGETYSLLGDILYILPSLIAVGYVILTIAH